VLWWRVGSWQRIANMCRSSSRTVSFTFSRTRGLVQLGGLQNVSLEYLRHITPGLDSACVSIRCSDAQPSAENSSLLLHNS
jgi:hypothetical protein